MTYCCHCGCEMFRYSEVCPSCGKRVVKADLGMGWKLLASLPIIAALIFGAYVYYNYEAWTEDIYTAGYTEGYERGEVYGKSAGKKVGFETGFDSGWKRATEVAESGEGYTAHEYYLWKTADKVNMDNDKAQQNTTNRKPPQNVQDLIEMWEYYNTLDK